MIEKWKSIIDYEGMYEYSDQGRIRSIDRIVYRKICGSVTMYKRKGKILKPHITKGGYLYVILYKNSKNITKYIHRLIAESVYGKCPVGYEVAHNNGVQSDNRFENLRFDTPKGNQADRKLHGTTYTGEHKGEKNGNAKLIEAQVKTIINMIKEGFTNIQIAKCFDVNQSTINNIRYNQTWNHIPRQQSVISHINSKDFLKVV